MSTLNCDMKTVNYKHTDHTVKSNRMTVWVLALASDAVSVSSNPSFLSLLERKHCIFSLAMFKYHSQGCGWEAVWELLSFLPLFLSLSGPCSEEYQSTAYDIPSITVIPRESSNSYTVRQTLLDTVTKTTWHALSYRVYLRWNCKSHF